MLGFSCKSLIALSAWIIRILLAPLSHFHQAVWPSVCVEMHRGIRIQGREIISGTMSSCVRGLECWRECISLHRLTESECSVIYITLWASWWERGASHSLSSYPICHLSLVKPKSSPETFWVSEKTEEFMISSETNPTEILQRPDTSLGATVAWRRGTDTWQL